MSQKREIKPIAFIYNDFLEKFGIPRQSGKVCHIQSMVVFEPEFRVAEAIRGIEQFSHLWLIFDFSKSHTDKFSPTVRPPRLGGNTRIGVFASRSPFRPNSLGLSSVKLERIEKTAANGNVLIVSGADLLNGTPIYDIKPYLAYTDCHVDAVGGYADAALEHILEVSFLCDTSKIEKKKLSEIESLLKEDPRPSYQDSPERLYSMRYGQFDVKFYVKGGCAEVVEIKKQKNFILMQ